MDSLCREGTGQMLLDLSMNEISFLAELDISSFPILEKKDST